MADTPKEVTPKRRKSAKRASAPTKKVAAKKSTGPAKKSAAKSRPAAKKVAAKTPAKSTRATSKKAPAKSSGSGRGGFHRELNEHGFVPGTDSAKIADVLMKGGTDRNDINEKARKAIGGQTRNGTEKNVPALVSGVLNRLVEQGYKVDATWALTPPKRKAAKK